MTSAIDLAIDTGKKPISSLDLIKARNNIPQKVALVDPHSVYATMRDAIFQEGVLWQTV